MDDFGLFRKALLTADDWRNAFNSYLNLSHAYHLFFAGPVVSLFGSTTTQVLDPAFGRFGGAYRALSLATIINHVLLAVTLAYLAVQLTGSRLVGIVALVIWVTNPITVFWMPLIDSRFVGYAPMLLGMIIFLRTIGTPCEVACLALVGFLFSLAQSLHYNALYMIVPFVLGMSIYILILRRQGAFVPLAAWLAGCLSLPILFEVMATFVSYRDVEPSPFLSMVQQQLNHAIDVQAGPNGEPMSATGAIGSLAWLLNDIPVWEVVLVAFGTLLFARMPPARTLPPGPIRWTILVAIFLVPTIVVLDGAIVDLRRAYAMLPFVAILQAFALVEASKRLTGTLPFRIRRAWATVLLVVVGVGIIGVHRWDANRETWKSHFATGQLVSELRSNLSPERRIVWLGNNVQAFDPVALVLRAHPDDVIAVELPVVSLVRYPAFYALIAGIQPERTVRRQWQSHGAPRPNIRAWPSLVDSHPALTGVRVFRAGVIQSALAAEIPTPVTASLVSDQHNSRGVAGLFDRDIGILEPSVWESTGRTETILLRFDAPQALDGVTLVSPIDDATGVVQCGFATVRVFADGEWTRPLGSAAIEPRRAIPLATTLTWPQRSMQSLWIELTGCLHHTTIRLAEILMPGRRVFVDPGTRTRPMIASFRFDGFASDRQIDWRWCFRFLQCSLSAEPGSQLRIHADGFGTGNAAVYVDGTRVATENDPFVQGALLALLPADLSHGSREVFIGDAHGSQRSQTAILHLGPNRDHRQGE